MKRFKNIQTVFVAMGLAFVFYSCCRDDDNTCSDPTNPECENYDPCYGKTDIRRADFLIETSYTIPGQIVYVSDTIFGYNLSPLQFKSVDNSLITNHVWYVGSEILTTDEVVRDFNNVPRPSDITVSHVVTYQNLSPCNPLDNGRDSVAVTFPSALTTLIVAVPSPTAVT